MESRKRTLYVKRICAGYLPYKTYRIQHPSRDIDYQSEIIYDNSYEQSLNDGFFTDDDLLEILLDNNLWDAEKELQLEQLPKDIENFKVELFNSPFQKKKRDDLRKYIKRANETLFELIAKRYIYESWSVGGIASYDKTIFVVENSVCDASGNKIDPDEFNIIELLGHINKNQISEDNIRELARTEPWQSIWNASKDNNVFGTPSVDMTTDQRRLILWSSLYDNIRESPDCPHDSIIEDDDMLDGWLILQRRKRDADLKKKDVEDQISNPKIANSQEIFIIADNKDDADKIDGMNSSYNKALKKQRLKQIQKKGSMKDAEFLDVKRDLAMEKNRIFIEKVKGGKNG